MTLTKFVQEVVDYLYNKVPDMNAATMLEIAEFVAMKANNYATDMVKDNSERWLDYIRKNDEWYLKILKERH
jgi:hypothetical protein